jgi:hypothetical protein
MFVVSGSGQPDRDGVVSTEKAPAIPAPRRIPKVAEKCPMAETKATLADLRKDSRAPVYLPDDVRPTDMWTCGPTPVVMVGPIRTSFETGWDKIDPMQKWPGLIQADGGRIETIAGRPAYIHPGTLGGKSAVQFVVNGTSIVILAEPTTPVEKLIEFAKSIEFPAEGPHNYERFDPKTDPDTNADLRDPHACDIEALENCHQ